MVRTGLTNFLLFAAVALAVTGTAFIPTSAEAQPIQIRVDLSRDTIGLDEVALLQVVITGTEQNLPAPRLPGLPMFEVYSQGQSTNLSITNGQVESSVTYRYQLVPTKAGSFVIANVAVVYRNKRFTGNEVRLTVLDQGRSTSTTLEKNAQDGTGRSRDYFLLADVNKKRPFVNEQVTLTLKFCVAVQLYNRPELTAPQTTGFWTELLGNRPSYTQVINGRTYQVLEIKYALFPTQTGELTIGRAMIRTTVATGSRPNRRSIFNDLFPSGEEVTVRSRPITINVRPLPQEGKPADFSGTIGNFTISAEADKAEVDVNEPVTVTIRIRGQGNIASVAEPAIGDLEDFRVYRASSSENTSHLNDVLGGTKTFEEVFIPRRPGELTIPALSLSYFNPRTGKYQKKKTQPITLHVEAGESYTGNEDLPYAPSGISIGSEARDIRFIKGDIGDLTGSGRVILTSPAYLIINGVPVLAFIGLVVYRSRQRRLNRHTALVRSRAASRIAKKRLATARKLAGGENKETFYAELGTAVLSYVADKVNVSPHGLTSDSVAAMLRDRGASDELVTGVSDFLRRCDFARYAPSDVDDTGINEDLQRAEDLIIQLERVKIA
jgi:hypothetical protein